MTSIVWNTVTCGAVNALAIIAAAVCLRTPRIGMRVTGPSSVKASVADAIRLSLDVGPGDQPLSTGTDEVLEVDAELPGEVSHGRRRPGSLAPLPRCRDRDGPGERIGLGAARSAHRPSRVLGARTVSDEVGLGSILGFDRLDRRTLRGHRERHERIADTHGLAGSRVQGRDDTRVRRRQFDEGLRGLDLGDDLVELDGIPFGDAPRDDVGLGESFTEVGQPELAQAHANSAVADSVIGATRPSTRSTPNSMRSRSGTWCRSSRAGG